MAFIPPIAQSYCDRYGDESEACASDYLCLWCKSTDTCISTIACNGMTPLQHNTTIAGCEEWESAVTIEYCSKGYFVICIFIALFGSLFICILGGLFRCRFLTGILLCFGCFITSLLVWHEKDYEFIYLVIVIGMFSLVVMMYPMKRMLPWLWAHLSSMSRVRSSVIEEEESCWSTFAVKIFLFIFCLLLFVQFGMTAYCVCVLCSMEDAMSRMAISVILVNLLSALKSLLEKSSSTALHVTIWAFATFFNVLQWMDTDRQQIWQCCVAFVLALLEILSKNLSLLFCFAKLGILAWALGCVSLVGSMLYLSFYPDLQSTSLQISRLIMAHSLLVLVPVILNLSYEAWKHSSHYGRSQINDDDQLIDPQEIAIARSQAAATPSGGGSAPIDLGPPSLDYTETKEDESLLPSSQRSSHSYVVGGSPHREQSHSFPHHQHSIQHHHYSPQGSRHPSPSSQKSKAHRSPSKSPYHTPSKSSRKKSRGSPSSQHSAPKKSPIRYT